MLHSLRVLLPRRVSVEVLMLMLISGGVTAPGVGGISTSSAEVTEDAGDGDGPGSLAP